MFIALSIVAVAIVLAAGAFNRPDVARRVGVAYALFALVSLLLWAWREYNAAAFVPL